MSAPTESFRILYVCVGNLCRSVFAEKLTLREIGNQPWSWASRIEVASAGTRAKDGEPMHPITARVLSERGFDETDFAARRITPALLQATDLILTATIEERDDVVERLPRALPRTFTVNEFARLGAYVSRPEPEPEHDPVERARRRVAAMIALRGRVTPRMACADGTVLGDDIPDPKRRTEPFRSCANAIEATTRLIVQNLRCCEERRCAEPPEITPLSSAARGETARS